MTRLDAHAIAQLAQVDKVHRSVYTDPEIFTLEMERIFGRAWIFVAHESQIKQAGDFVRSRIGAREVIVTRDAEGAIHVLHNSCAHRGMRVCLDRSGTAKTVVCPYHGWAYRQDGSLIGVPYAQGYDGTLEVTNPKLWLKRVPRVASYRGFVFACESATGPSIEDYLGVHAEAFDNMVDRSPTGEIEIAGGGFRQEYRGNWKLHMENAIDLLHPGFVHESSVDGADSYVRAHPADSYDQALQMFHANGFGVPLWNTLTIKGHDNGHVYMTGFYRGGVIDPNRRDPVFLRYKETLERRLGAEKCERVLARDTFNNLFYPNISINTRFQQLRVIQPIAVDRSVVQSYAFRLIGAPEEMFHVSVRFSTTANSPASLVSADDLAIFTDCQIGMSNNGPQWIDLSRGAISDLPGNDGTIVSGIGTSELPLRSMFGAWSRYMRGAV